MAGGWDFLTTTADSLFSTQQERDSAKIGTLQNIAPEQLLEFKNHTFKIRDDVEMQELINSIRDNGVIEPAIAFYNEDNQIELISGHRRRYASLQLGIDTMPVLIKNVTRDEAIIAMGETNLQKRNVILPSEKAFTYKVMLDALKRQGRRSDLIDFLNDTHKKRYNATEILEKKVNESRMQIQRYIRLTYLNDNLLNLVDIGKMGLRPAVEISYFDSSIQNIIYDVYEESEITPSHAQTLRIKALSADARTENEIRAILSEAKPNQKESIKVSSEIKKRYFKNCTSSLEIENRIIIALQLLEQQERQSGIKIKEPECEIQ